MYCQDYRDVPIRTEYHFPREMFRAVCYKPITDTTDRRYCKLATLVTSRDEPIAQFLTEHEVQTVQLRPVAEWREAEWNVQCAGAVGTDTDCWPWSGWEWLIVHVRDAFRKRILPIQQGNTSAPDGRTLRLHHVTKVSIRSLNERSAGFLSVTWSTESGWIARSGCQVREREREWSSLV